MWGKELGGTGRAVIRRRNRIQNKVVVDRDVVECQTAGRRDTETRESETIETQNGRGRKNGFKKEKLR